MRVRWIHAADLHLDSPLAGLAAYKDAPTQLLRTATREAFERLIERASQEKVDFMILAGDIYDGSWKDLETGIWFAKMMGRLRAAGIQVVMVDGNHDAESEIERRLQLPENVYRFPSDRAATFEMAALKVALHGRSFKHAATTENLSAGYPPPKLGWLNVGVLHTALEGHSDHSAYAPCTRQELASKGYQYFALGHVHEHWMEKVGGCTIAFPGNLQGRHIKECGPRGALIVEAEDGEVVSVERIFTDVLRWERVTIDIGEYTTMREVLQGTSAKLVGLHAETQWDGPIAVRVEFVGSSTAHAELVANSDYLRAEVLALAAAAANEKLWIEKVKLHSTSKESVASISSRGDAVAELAKALTIACDDPEFLASLDEELKGVVAKLERPVAEQLEIVGKVREGKIGEVAASMVADVIARISAGGQAE